MLNGKNLLITIGPFDSDSGEDINQAIKILAVDQGGLKATYEFTATVLTRTMATVAATVTAVSPVVPVFDASSLYTKKDAKK